MAKKQTRRSISIRGLLYQRLSSYADNAERSRSDIVEKLVIEFLNGVGQPEETVLKPRVPRPRRVDKDPQAEEDSGPACFTF